MKKWAKETFGEKTFKAISINGIEKGINHISHQAQEEVKSFITRHNSKTNDCAMLASQYNTPFNNNLAKAGCPSILSPLETQPIDLTWGLKTNNEDKTDRFNQFYDALKAYETYVTNNGSFKGAFLALNINGRVMFVNIAKNMNNIAAIKEISSYAHENISQNPTYPEKSSITEMQVFDHFIKPQIEQYIPKANPNENNNFDQTPGFSEDKTKIETTTETPKEEKLPASVNNNAAETTETPISGIEEGFIMVAKDEKIDDADEIHQQRVYQIIDELSNKSKSVKELISESGIKLTEADKQQIVDSLVSCSLLGGQDDYVSQILEDVNSIPIGESSDLPADHE
jgi:hypothetical protein